MKNNTLIIITIIYLILSILFNYGVYHLIVINESNDQYFLIFIYFLSEVLAFLFFFFPKSKDKIIAYTLGPILITDESMNISNITISDNNVTNNFTTSIGATDSHISTKQPFVGMKWISFAIPCLFDFLSKFFIFNGLKMLGNEIIFRSIIELSLIILISKIFLKSKYDKFSIIGVFTILFGLIISSFYFHLTKGIKLYFDSDKFGILGMLLCTLGEIFSCIQLFFQVKYFKIGEKFCFREIAWEGLFGLIISFIVFELSIFIPCSNETNENRHKSFFYCYKDPESLTPFKFLLNNIKNNIAWNIIIFLISMLYNLLGAILTKYVGEVYKVAVDVGRVSIILYLILFINTDNKTYLNIIISGIFMLIIISGIVLSIILRKQKDITFEQIQLDKTFSQNDSLASDNNITASYIDL